MAPVVSAAIGTNKYDWVSDKYLLLSLFIIIIIIIAAVFVRRGRYSDAIQPIRNWRGDQLHAAMVPSLDVGRRSYTGRLCCSVRRRVEDREGRGVRSVCVGRMCRLVCQSTLPLTRSSPSSMSGYAFSVVALPVVLLYGKQNFHVTTQMSRRIGFIVYWIENGCMCVVLSILLSGWGYFCACIMIQLILIGLVKEVRAIGSRCHHSKFILSIQTTTNVHDRNRNSTTTLSLAITLPWLTLQLTD